MIQPMAYLWIGLLTGLGFGLYLWARYGDLAWKEEGDLECAGK